MEKDSGWWAFRGQPDKHLELSTRFERDAERYKCTPYFRKNREVFILKEFQRRAHRYQQNLPEYDNYIQWLSLLQHFGGTTRLLDFTFSFYIAAFFALETSITDSAIWAVNINRLKESIDKKMDTTTMTPEMWLRENQTKANQCIDEKENDESVLIIDTFLQHERISIQQGLFLFPCKRETPFEKNLCSVFAFPYDRLRNVSARKLTWKMLPDLNFRDISILKIIIPQKLHADILYDLRDMNVTAETLFPGLDGFARSLNLHMRVFELARYSY
ncbi:MAG: FRG domain-containing protein [Syntrophorhabdaceae bacterium]|nr:FRG domain-containing protein [Syntrophorhabdaceae bacterium]MDD5243075.1 FRG domain-containing protein [Syntrophorhabdaceae bacterium]